MKMKILIIKYDLTTKTILGIKITLLALKLIKIRGE